MGRWNETDRSRGGNHPQRESDIRHPTGLWRMEGLVGIPRRKDGDGETPEEALKREIWEELETRIVVERLVETVEWDYPAFHLTMHCYLCHVESGHLELKEHEAAKWLNRDELESVRWLPADWEIVRKLKL